VYFGGDYAQRFYRILRDRFGRSKRLRKYYTHTVKNFHDRQSGYSNTRRMTLPNLKQMEMLERVSFVSVLIK